MLGVNRGFAYADGRLFRGTSDVHVIALDAATGQTLWDRELDSLEPLVEEARRAGLDVERFRVDLASNAALEAFGNDLEEVRSPPPDALLASSGRISFPSVLFIAEDGSRQGAWEFRSYGDLRAAADAVRAMPVADPAPGVVEALRGLVHQIEPLLDSLLGGERAQRAVLHHSFAFL